MADQGDVEQVMAAIVSGVLYPLGTGSPSITGLPCRVHRGWPDAATLDADLLAGRVTVTVAGDTRGQRNTTRYPDEWRPTQSVVPGLAVTVTGNTATFSGNASIGQLAGILADQVAAVHRTVAGDTPQTVASALAGALAGVAGPLAATVAEGAAVQVSGASSIVARVFADQPSIRETRRQLQAFRVVCWCPDPASRDLVASAIDIQMATFDFLGLPDGMAGRLRYIATASTDRVQDAALYRRDLIYTMDYATTLTADLPRMLFGETQISGDGVIIKTLLT
jgi:hypothetical protein